MRIRTGYSFRTAVGHLNEVVDRIVETGATAAVISDRESTYGYRRFRDACKKKNIKPIYGVELGTITKIEKKPAVNYCTFLAKSDIESVNAIIGKATKSGAKEPWLLVQEGTSFQTDGLVTIIGERATWDGLVLFRGKEDTYLALSPSTPKALIRAAKENQIPLIATSDNYFPREDDLEFYRTTLGRRANTQTYRMHILSDEEWSDSVKYIVRPEVAQEALNNRNNVIASLNAELVNAEMYQPERPKSLYDMCVDGAARVGVDLNDPVYSARLERELNLIKEKDFEDYFYIIADIVNWAKECMIVGPARGSSCGSLVCYLLNITTIDPIPYGLIFERFIDINRKDMPDIDIDFSDVNRHKVFEYMEGKYGKEHVARLGTVGMFKQRTAIKAAATALKIPIGLTEKFIVATEDRLSVKETFETTEAGQQLSKQYPLSIIAERIENHPNVASQHAAGMLVTRDPIIKYVAVDSRSNSAMIDKKDAEALNLLKIDALGLTQLSVFERTLALLGHGTKTKDGTIIKSGWFENLPLDDQKAFDILNEGRFSGIFQFMGRALQGLCSEVHVDNLEDIISITALARPGPMAAGGAGSWVKRRSGKEPVEYIHPIMEDLTKDTYGVIVYQEQVMHIVRKVGLMSWEDTSDIRRAIGKSLGKDALEQYYEKFKIGALENGLEEHKAREIWDAIITFGRYGFNRSHAVAYGIVSYYCCWLKAYHPVEFCAATLDSEADVMKQIRMLRELRDEGVDYIPLDIEKSTKNWEVTERDGKRLLVGPLTAIRGVGPKFVNQILAARNGTGELSASLQKKLKNAKTEIDSLYPVEDATKKQVPDLTIYGEKVFGDSFDIEAFTPIENIKPGIAGTIYAIGVVKKLTVKDENDPELVERRRGKNVFDEKYRYSLAMFIGDDTDEIFCKIDNFAFPQIGKSISDRGSVGKAIYLVKGTVPKGFRMISVDNINFLGMME